MITKRKSDKRGSETVHSSVTSSTSSQRSSASSDKEKPPAPPPAPELLKPPKPIPALLSFSNNPKGSIGPTISKAILTLLQMEEEEEEAKEQSDGLSELKKSKVLLMKLCLLLACDLIFSIPGREEGAIQCTRIAELSPRVTEDSSVASVASQLSESQYRFVCSDFRATLQAQLRSQESQVT